MKSNKMWIVAQREFNIRVRKKSFIIMTILMPFLMAALIFLPLMLSTIKDDGEKTVAVIDNTGLYSHVFQNEGNYKFVPIEKMDASFRSDTTEMAAVIQISGNLMDNPNAAAIYSSKEIPSELRQYVENTLTSAVRNQKITNYNIPELENILEDMQEEITVETIKWTEEGEQQSQAEMAMLCGMVLTFLIYMFVMSYGGMVMQGIIEEKTNRIVELMVSSLKPTQMLFGKIIGIGLVGLFQMLIWGVLLGVIVMVASLSADIPLTDPSTMPMEGDADFVRVFMGMPLSEMFVMFILYFVGGYLFYASILAAFGSAVSEPQDSQQFMMPIIIVMIFALYAGIYSVENPDGPLAFWTSYIPFTSPLVMMVRIPFGISLYEELISIAILYISVFCIIKISAKIYRVGILMYGKKPTYKDLMKWLKY